MVAVNSNLMRTTKLVLSKKGFSAVKVAILVGGPDWPTSVLCGILDLPLIPMLIGTLPVVIIVVPTVLSGSFIYLAENYTWAGTASAISMSFTGLTIMAMPMATMYHLEKAMEEKKDELAKMPFDQEVLLADENEEQRRVLYLETTKWKSLPVPLKIALIVGNIFMFISCYLALAVGGACFKDFTMSDSIEVDLGGRPWSLIKRLGWVSIFLFLIAGFCLCFFSLWAKKVTNSAMTSIFIVGARKSGFTSASRMGNSNGKGCQVRAENTKGEEGGEGGGGERLAGLEGGEGEGFGEDEVDFKAQDDRTEEDKEGDVETGETVSGEVGMT